MGEPITLYAPDGSEIVVYGNAQKAVMEAEGCSLTPPVAPSFLPPADAAGDADTPSSAADAPEMEPPPIKRPRKVTKRTGNL